MVLEIPNIWQQNNKTYNYRKLKSYKIQTVYNEQYSEFSVPTYQSLMPVSIEKMIILEKEDTEEFPTLENINDESVKVREIIRKDGLYYKKSTHRKLGFNKYREREFCSRSCSTSYTNKERSIEEKNKKPKKKCLNCGEELDNNTKTYCNIRCFHEYKYKNYIKKWKNEEISGTIGDVWIDISDYIRRYIFEKYDYKCAQCGWAEINPYTGTLPLEIEHIDGDATNNKEENLILLCPNCHSLTSTYRGANKGNGKRNITWLSRDCGKHKEFDI